MRRWLDGVAALAWPSNYSPTLALMIAAIVTNGCDNMAQHRLQCAFTSTQVRLGMQPEDGRDVVQTAG
jgi:hypothetical protein